MTGELNEKCAVVGVFTNPENTEDVAAGICFEGLFALQHRGSEATGMAGVTPAGELVGHYAPQLVINAYDDRQVAERLRECDPVIGHNRYSTSGSKTKHPQPVEDKALGFAFAHNGNLPETSKLETFLERRNLLHGGVNDSEMMGLTIAQLIREGHDLPGAVEQAFPLFTGAFSCVAMQDKLLVAFRDPYGIRPLALGQLEDGGYVIGSETCGLNGATYRREVMPGELVIISEDGVESKQLAEGKDMLDAFEFVYFARPDSHLYGQTVNEVRRRLGVQLSNEHGDLGLTPENTVVVPVPATSIPIAEGYAEARGFTLEQLIVKNGFTNRTFMQPTQEERRKQQERKHNLIPERMSGRDIILVDDSIVRSNTMPKLVNRVLSAGARSVSVLIGSPPIRFPDYYGIDTPKQSELIAANMTIEGIRKRIGERHEKGCRYLGFLPISRLVEAIGVPAENLNLSCFTGEYPIDIGEHKSEIKPPLSMECVV